MHCLQCTWGPVGTVWLTIPYNGPAFIHDAMTTPSCACENCRGQPPGLEKLSKLLQRLRQDARAEIDFLTRRVAELRAEKLQLSARCDAAEDELAFTESVVHQLRLENSKKYRVEERNDWRALVDTIQADRRELQEECARLKEAGGRHVDALGVLAIALLLATNSSLTEAELERRTSSPDRRSSGSLSSEAMASGGTALSALLSEIEGRGDRELAGLVAEAAGVVEKMVEEGGGTMAALGSRSGSESSRPAAPSAGEGTERNGGTPTRRNTPSEIERRGGPEGETVERLRLRLQQATQSAEVTRISLEATLRERDREIIRLKQALAQKEGSKAAGGHDGNAESSFLLSWLWGGSGGRSSRRSRDSRSFRRRFSLSPPPEARGSLVTV